MIEDQKLSEYAGKIHNLFGFSEQCNGLILLITEAVGSRQGCLLFPDYGWEDFTFSFCAPDPDDNPFSTLVLNHDNPIVDMLKRKKKILTKEKLAEIPELNTGRVQSTENLFPDEIEMLIPIISRKKMIGILVLGEKVSGKYSSEECDLLEGVLSQVAVSLEKEFLREQLSQLYSEVEEKARIDGLTGLLNRRSLDETIASEINRYSRYGGIFSLIMLDLESLTKINNKYGHLAGDDLLKETGNKMNQSIRSADRAFRYGGDEFAILLPNTSIDAATRVAERIRKQIASIKIADDISVTASLGLAGWPENGKSPEEIIGAADAALYKAKESGGNQIKQASNS
ncbi:diguanylate cyclase [Chloroflexota bacterium]